MWVGNADGEGRPGLTGVGAAAPLMFDVFNLLPSTAWFAPPYDEMQEVQICRQSGYRAGRFCEILDTAFISRMGLESTSCPFHMRIHLDSTQHFRVNSNCEEQANMVHKNWFVLPPAMEWYYKKRNALYRTLPPFRTGCSTNNLQTMQLIYPRSNDRIFVPLDRDASLGNIVFEAVHHNPEAEIFWHIDGNFMGTTSHIHQIELCPDEGEHLLSLVDDKGNVLYKKFTIVGKIQNKIDPNKEN